MVDLLVGAKSKYSSENIIQDKIHEDGFNARIVQIFTDGSYSSSHPTICGLGIHFPNGEFKDVSESFIVRPTNQRAELMAILRAIQIVRETDATSVIEIHTDSQYAIGACTHWLPKWKRNGWKAATGKDICNQDILQPLSLLLTNVWFHHVKAHTNNDDYMSVHNECADQLAKQACLNKQIVE
jgi:ribonuclease HI